MTKKLINKNKNK